MLTQKKIDEIFEETTEGYSFSRYGEDAWRKSIEYLVSLGLKKKQVVEIMLSKLMRWAGDSFAPCEFDENGDVVEKWGNFNGDEIAKYNEKYGLRIRH